jgi:DNA-binding transcriptional ArsR family regulator
VQQNDGTIVNKIASMRKSIYSIGDLAEITRAANMRYLDFLSALDDPTQGASKLARVSKTIRQHNHPYKGFNFFDTKDLLLLRTIARGEYTIAGFCNRQIRSHIGSLSPSQITRIIKRLRIHGLIRKLTGAYRYRLTKLGTLVVALGLKLREFFVVPNLALCN